MHTYTRCSAGSINCSATCTTCRRPRRCSKPSAAMSPSVPMRTGSWSEAGSCSSFPPVRTGGKLLQLPASAHDPVLIGTLGDIAADGFEHRLGRRQVVQVALQLIEPTEHRVYVCILEGREDHAPIDVDSSHGRRSSFGHLVERTHGRNSVTLDQDRLGRAASPEIYGPPGQKQVRHEPEQPF